MTYTYDVQFKKLRRPRKPITALRRCEADLSLLRFEVRNLGEKSPGLMRASGSPGEIWTPLAARFQREFEGREEPPEFQIKQSASNVKCFADCQ